MRRRRRWVANLVLAGVWLRCSIYGPTVTLTGLMATIAAEAFNERWVMVRRGWTERQIREVHGIHPSETLVRWHD